LLNLRAVQSGNPEFEATGVSAPVRNVGDRLNLRFIPFAGILRKVLIANDVTGLLKSILLQAL